MAERGPYLPGGTANTSSCPFLSVRAVPRSEYASKAYLPLESACQRSTKASGQGSPAGVRTRRSRRKGACESGNWFLVSPSFVQHRLRVFTYLANLAHCRALPCQVRPCGRVTQVHSKALLDQTAGSSDVRVTPKEPDCCVRTSKYTLIVGGSVSGSKAR